MLNYVDATAEKIARLPIDFAAGDVSPVDLVRESGYIACRTDITPAAIEARLLPHPDWVRAWFRYSEDQRGSPAWWVGGIGDGRYQVGYYDPSLQKQAEPFEYDSKARAAAEFAMRHVDGIADWIERDDRLESPTTRLWRRLRAREPRDIRER